MNGDAVSRPSKNGGAVGQISDDAEEASQASSTSTYNSVLLVLVVHEDGCQEDPSIWERLFTKNVPEGGRDVIQ